MAKRKPKKVKPDEPVIVDSPPTESDGLGMIPANFIKERSPTWFWENRLENGTVAILQGEKGAGKSTWLRHFAAVATGGATMPYAKRPKKFIGKVLYFAGEESVDTRVRPCLDAAGADLDAVYIADAHGMFGRRLELPNDCNRLHEAIASMRVALVVVDPVFNFLSPSADLSGPTDPARQFMRRVGAVAQATDCLIIFTRNLQKRRNDGALSAGRGSAEVANCARSVLHCQHVALSQDKALAVAACNSGTSDTESILYRIVDKGGRGVIRVTGTSTMTADELVAGESGDLDRSLFDQCKDLLTVLLVDGRVQSTVVKAKAEAAGLSMRTMQQAAKAMGVTYERDGTREDTTSYWVPNKEG